MRKLISYHLQAMMSFFTPAMSLAYYSVVTTALYLVGTSRLEKALLKQLQTPLLNIRYCSNTSLFSLWFVDSKNLNIYCFLCLEYERRMHGIVIRQSN